MTYPRLQASFLEDLEICQDRLLSKSHSEKAILNGVNGCNGQNLYMASAENSAL
jgi:hypothetical protein